MLAGGAVNGGFIRGEWPGLSRIALLDERDLAPANQLESLFKATLVHHLGLTEAQVEENVFPNTRKIKPLDNLFGV